MREIIKVGLAAFKNEKIFLVRKKGSSVFILPGGKPEEGEDDVDTLRREIHEELGCGLQAHSIASLGVFSDTAADHVDTMVTVRLFAAILEGHPQASAEIEELAWVDMDHPGPIVMAPSLSRQIIPFLSPGNEFGHLDLWLVRSPAANPVVKQANTLT